MQFTADSAVLETNPLGQFHGCAQISGYLRFPNGTVYRIDGSAVTWIQDRNGNRTSFGYTKASGSSVYLNWYLSAWAPTQITDPLNRTININYNDSSCGGCTSLTYLGAGDILPGWRDTRVAAGVEFAGTIWDWSAESVHFFGG